MDDAAHVAIMIRDSPETPMNVGDKPSPASWRRAAGNAAKTENPAKQGGLTDSCSEPFFLCGGRLKCEIVFNAR
jgi:hypothetical protein